MRGWPPGEGAGPSHRIPGAHTANEYVPGFRTESCTTTSFDRTLPITRIQVSATCSARQLIPTYPDQRDPNVWEAADEATNGRYSDEIALADLRSRQVQSLVNGYASGSVWTVYVHLLPSDGVTGAMSEPVPIDRCF